ncbi:hypothetical protein QFC21_004089 [Naganishia friedmannii]|uniref:Uncharacterized protein n=1 Tax=Naganishia friedmannii TaxID=89922 RepID=A0ACC2VJP1_9TREE|nr:hypothetical protein QFC21_004089 [Naganishia friedmannii]
MPRPPQSTPSGKHFLTKAAPKELFESELLGHALSLRTSDESSINAEHFDLAVAAVKRLNSLMTKASPDVQQDALRTIKTSLSESAANAIARAVLDGTSTLAEKSTAQKAHDLLQGLASMCQILTGLNQGEQAASIAAPFVESGIVNGSTAQLRVAGAKPMIVILSHMQNFVNANSLPEDLIGEVLQGIDISGESAYRSRLILGLISNQAYTQRLGYPGSQEAAAALLRTWYRPGQLSKSDLSALSIHFLPILLEKYPTLAVHSLKDISQSASTAAIGDKSAYLAAWTAIARVAVVVSCLKLAELDMRLLKWAIHHGEDSIRLDAWFILTRCSSPTDQLEDLLLDEQGLIAEWLSSNMSVPSLEFRSDYLAAFGKFVDRLYTSANAAVRQNQKPIAQGKQGDAIAEEEFEQQKVSRREYMGRIVQLVQIMLNRFIDPSILLPMSTYHARIITALAMLSYLEQNLGSRQAGKKAGRNQVTWPTIYTEERVDSLIACLTSNFTDVRTQAAELLEFAPSPLPGYTDGSRRNSLLEMALERLNGARNTDAEAGGLLIQVLYHSLEGAPSIGHSLTAQETPAQPDLFLSLLENLEKRVMRISGSATLEEEPLHGILLALM